MASSSSSTANPLMEAPAEAPESPEAAGEAPKMRKRKEEGKWKKNIAKKKRNSGEEYVAHKSDKIVPARRVGDPCGCPKDCFGKVGDDAIQRIFKNYWNMGSHNAQSAYITKMVTSKEVKNPSVGDSSRRKATREYTVNVDNETVVVCKKAFLSMHNVSDKRVRNVLANVGETGVAPTDRRGQGPSINKQDEEMRNLGSEHIKSLPLCSSHYSRPKSVNRLYLPPTHTQPHCYSLFQLWCQDKGVPEEKVMSFDAYRRLFNTFNIGTSPPKV